MEWKQVEGYQPERPKEVDAESSPTTVYLRRDIESVPNVEDGVETEGTHWQYEEAQLTKEEFAAVAYAKILENQKSMDATLADILLNQMEEV